MDIVKVTNTTVITMSMIVAINITNSITSNLVVLHIVIVILIVITSDYL